MAGGSGAVGAVQPVTPPVVVDVDVVSVVVSVVSVAAGSAAGVVAAGVVAAAGMATLALALGQLDSRGWGACVAAAFIANTAESVLGASLQGRVAWLSNDIVNVLQISLAAALAVLFGLAAPAL